jgi:hypothetical protein
VHHEVDHTAGVAVLIVVPRHQLHEAGVETDARLGVEHGGGGAGHVVL